MMKHRIIPAIIAAATASLLLVGCNAGTMQNGTYRAESKDYDSHGWKDYVVVTVEDGKYTKVEFDAVNENGEKKSQDEEYAAAYPSGQDYVKPAEYSKRLPEELMKKQDIDKVDVIASATTSSNTFKKLVGALEDPILKGITDTLTVDISAKG